MQILLTTLTTLLALTLPWSPIMASENAIQGDVEAGKTKAAVCGACHGPDGNSAVPNFPTLAGQQPGYTAKQLADFKSDTRTDGTMNGMVASLSDQDMLDLDAFFASQAPTPGEISADQEEAARAGEAIYRAGLAEFSVTSCMACHGPDGKGVQPMYPRLSGQHAVYIEKQLLDFKSGARTDPMMNNIAFPLSEEQIKNLSLYISGLN